MYRQKLQDLCQQRKWAPPLYTSAKEGPDHNPRFRASVTVGGATFDGPQDALSRTSKQAQNEAAQVAFDHFAADAAAPAATPPPPPPPLAQASSSSSVRIEGDDDQEMHEELKGCGSDADALTVDVREMRYFYKNQLQIYTQKKNLNLPTYKYVREGSLHAPRFKASVTVDGQTFESPQYLGTLKDAEHSAAKVALMSLSAVGNHEEEHGFYKNLLHELAQKEGFTMPTYKTVGDGPLHMPIFSSTVEIEGEDFHGDAAKTRKQAEINAAKVAWTRLRERKSRRLPAGFSSKFQLLDISSGASSSLVSTDSLLPGASKPPVLCTKHDAEASSSVRTEGDDDQAKNEELKGCRADADVLTMDVGEMRYLYKNQLQIYTQKRNLNLPSYDHVRDGSLRAPRFKASVTVDGQTFETPQYLGTLKDAEHAAAKVALMSLSAVGNQEEEHGFYKNLLQELVQKESFSMPTYKTVSDGPSHMPTFICTIEIEGEEFHGDATKTRKQAEINAAKVAWTRLRERKSRRLPAGFSSKFQVLDISDASSRLVSTGSLLTRASRPPVSCTKHDAVDNIEADQLRAKDEFIDAHVGSSLPRDDGTCVTEEVGGNGNGNPTARPRLQKPNSTEKRGQSPTPSSSDAVYAKLRDPFLEETVSSDDETSPVPPPSQDPSESPADATSVCPAENGESSTSCNRVLIYPRKPDFQIPPGTKLLPPSDEMWVAVSVEPSGRVARFARV